MSNLKKEQAIILLKVAAAMDLVMTAFENDEQIIFEEEKAFLRFKYGHLPKDRIVKKQITQCSFHSCLKKPVEYSHTVQKSGSLSHIAENGHLISPHSHLNPINDFGEVGINEASTFPGFCEEHEALFSCFENQKDFKAEQDYRLQLYRTICREIIASRLLSEKLKHSKAFYQKIRNNRLDELFEIALAGFGLDLVSAGIKKRKTKLKNQTILFYNHKLRQGRDYRRKLKKMANAILQDLDSEQNNLFYFDALILDFEIPLALAGRGGMNFQKGSVVRECSFIINVIPLSGKTILIMGALKQHKSKIKWYLSHFLTSPFHLISMVEAWMLYGSDHWFIKPGVWKTLPSETREEIYKEINFSDKNILAMPSKAILIEARIDLLKFYKACGDSHIEIFKSAMTEFRKKKITVPAELLS